MKKILLLTSCFFALLASSSSAQTINASLTDSAQGSYCILPAQATFYASAFVTGYNSGDVFTFYLFYGDGNSDTVTAQLTPNLYTWIFQSHTYVTPGTFTVSMICEGPNGFADTVVIPGMITTSNTCDTLQGYVFNDLDADCTKDLGETGIQGKVVEAWLSGSLHMSTYTDASGYYRMFLPIGTNYDLQIQNAPLTDYCPNSGIVNNAQAGNSYDFGFDCSANSFDLGGVMSAWGFRPGFATGHLYVYSHALFCTDDPNPSISITLDPLTSFVSATTTPTSVVGNVVTWDFPTYSAIDPYINVTLLTSLNAQIGDSVCFTYNINPVSGDADPSDNVFNVCSDVRNSWDPNMKEVSPRGIGAEGFILPNQQLDYTVHFQNTGNDVAYNIYILDTIDADLDISTLHITGSSHPMNFYMLPGNVVKFEFVNINLPDSNADEPGSHGHVYYSISPLASSTPGTEFTNTAYIYFDFNPAIITNTTLNTVMIGFDAPEEMAGSDFVIYPVPAQTVLNASFPAEGAWEIAITDVTGRITGTYSVKGSTAQFQLDGYKPGVYYIKAVSGEYSMTRSFVMQ